MTHVGKRDGHRDSSQNAAHISFALACPRTSTTPLARRCICHQAFSVKYRSRVSSTAAANALVAIHLDAVPVTMVVTFLSARVYPPIKTCTARCRVPTIPKEEEAKAWISCAKTEFGGEKDSWPAFDQRKEVFDSLK